MSRRAVLHPLSERLTPAEVAQLWFRRAAEFAGQIHGVHPDFPKAGPDGLYLRTQVKAWFDRWHGIRQNAPCEADAEEEAMRIARHGRGQVAALSG